MVEDLIDVRTIRQYPTVSRVDDGRYTGVGVLHSQRTNNGGGKEGIPNGGKQCYKDSRVLAIFIKVQFFISFAAAYLGFLIRLLGVCDLSSGWLSPR